jgi:metal-responsive CopG/Arc/MetJ family transcriptional regulator
MRHKIPDDKKKDKFSITIDEKLNELLNKFIEEKGYNRSRYIESLIEKDMLEKGHNIKKEF